MSAPRAMPELIIDRPELQPPLQRTLFRLLTLVAWTAYVYLWLPLVTLGAWWLALRIGLDELRINPGTVDVDLFLLLLKTAAIAILVMVGWAEYNRVRFQGKERRGPRPQVRPDETAADFGVDLEVARRLRGARHATLVLDDHAMPVDVRIERVLDDAPTVKL